MEATRQTGTARAVERLFAPGRLRRQSMAAAYERLVPLRRISHGQARKGKQDRIPEERRGAL
jgi:hypothetical protein